MAVVIVVVCMTICVEACSACGSVSVGVVLWYCGIGMVYPLNDGEYGM